jgi:GAF domain-containing protein
MQTKIAVAVQSLEAGHYEEQLQTIVDELPDAAGADSAFIALIGEDGQSIETVMASSSGFARCNPGALVNEKLEDWQWLRGRLGHLRVIEVADTLSGPKAARDDLERLHELHIGAALIIGFSVHEEIAGFLGIADERSVDGWDANLHLLMKLFGSSLAVGLERVRDREILDELQERNSLVAMTANDGIWDFDGESKRINLSRRWKTIRMMKMSFSIGTTLCIRTTSRVCRCECANTWKTRHLFLSRYIGCATRVVTGAG